MKQPGLAVISTGMVCALGNRSESVAAVTKAGISAYQASGAINRVNNQIIMAKVPAGALPPLPDEFALLNQQYPGHTFMVKMAAAALRDCLSESARQYPMPVFMACPELLPEKSARLETPFLEHLKTLSQCNIDLANSRRVYAGRPGGFLALDIAYKYFQATGAEFALLGGVDSFRHFDSQIDALDRQKRLLAEGVADGFAIGEGASFLLLASPQALEKYALTPLLFLGIPANTREPGHRYSDAPYRGDGLALAFRQALAAAPHLPIASLYTSLNGESFWAKEFGVAHIRNQKRLGAQLPVHHPAEYFGDLGAAMAPMLLSLVAHNETQPSLIYCSADGPERGAVCVWQPQYA
ncbi:MAG TPA: hypothetical protein VN030_01405 [Cellvibrio sp.]|nr:hypothetical protein [Cellvibrio sp.]